MCYIIHLYLVLGNCTQAHLQCTWVVPKYILQNSVLVHLQGTCTQVLSRCTCPNPVANTVHIFDLAETVRVRNIV